MTDHPDLISPGVVLRFMTVVVAIGIVTAAVAWWVLSPAEPGPSMSVDDGWRS